MNYLKKIEWIMNCIILGQLMFNNKVKNLQKFWTAPKKVEWLKKHSTFFSFWIY